jgi:small-conductance mechanosensitive channel
MDFNKFLQQAEQLWWLKFEILGNSLVRLLVALLVALLALFVLRLILGIVQRRVVRLAERTATRWDDGVVQMLGATRGWFLLAAAIVIGAQLLLLDEKISHILRTGFVLALLLQGALWGSSLMRFFIEHSMRQRRETDPAAATTISALSFVGQIVLWAIVLLVALDNLGINVTTLVTGLGIGGVAVALAAQNILGDLFASLSIILDRPFVLGDFIIVGTDQGTVEKIGLKTTRIRSLGGEQLIFSNNDLLQSRVRNMKRIVERRNLFLLGVTYDTPREKLAAIPGMVQAIIEAQDHIRFDRAHFKEFGPSSLNFEIVYFVTVPEFETFMDILQAVNLAIVDKFAAEGIEFAFPTQTVILQGAEKS